VCHVGHLSRIVIVGEYNKSMLKYDIFTVAMYTVSLRYTMSDAAKPSKIAYKSKAIPLQAWTGPEGSRTLRLPDFKKIGT